MSLACFLLSPVGTVDVGKARLMFWDLGGQEELQSLWDKVRLPGQDHPHPSPPVPLLSRVHPLGPSSAAFLTHSVPRVFSLVPSQVPEWLPVLSQLNP